MKLHHILMLLLWREFKMSHFLSGLNWRESKVRHFLLGLDWREIILMRFNWWKIKASRFLLWLIRQESKVRPLVAGLGFTLEEAALVRGLSAVRRARPATGAQVACYHSLGWGLHGRRRGPLLAQEDGLHSDVLEWWQVERGAKLGTRVILF